MSYASIEEALATGVGIEREFVCPMGHSKNPHASVNSLTGLWFCFSCKAGGHADMSRIQLDPFKLRQYIEKIDRALDTQIRVYTDSWLDQFDATGPGEYWLSRYSLETAHAHRLGIAPDRSYATIPVRSRSGEVLGVIRRDLTGTDKAKYRYPPGLVMGNYMYGFHLAQGDTLVLTEGATDAIAANEAGCPDTLAMYGSNITKAQATLIRQHSPARVLVAFDQDAAGESGYQRVREALGHDYPIHRMWWEEYNDLASIPLADRSKMIQETLLPR